MVTARSFDTQTRLDLKRSDTATSRGVYPRRPHWLTVIVGAMLWAVPGILFAQAEATPLAIDPDDPARPIVISAGFSVRMAAPSPGSRLYLIDATPIRERPLAAFLRGDRRLGPIPIRRARHDRSRNRWPAGSPRGRARRDGRWIWTGLGQYTESEGERVGPPACSRRPDPWSVAGSATPASCRREREVRELDVPSQGNLDDYLDYMEKVDNQVPVTATATGSFGHLSSRD